MDRTTGIMITVAIGLGSALVYDKFLKKMINDLMKTNGNSESNTNS